MAKVHINLVAGCIFLLVTTAVQDTSAKVRAPSGNALRAPRGKIILKPHADGQRFKIVAGKGVKLKVTRLSSFNILTEFRTPRGRPLAYKHQSPVTESIYIVGKRKRAIAREMNRLEKSLAFQQGEFSGGWSKVLGAYQKAEMSIMVGNLNRTGQATVVTQEGKNRMKMRLPVPSAIERANQVLLAR